MKKLLTVLTGVLLTMPLLTVNASALPSAGPTADIAPTHSVTGWCYLMINGRWYFIPC